MLNTSKTYWDWIQVGEPFKKNGKPYIKAKNPVTNAIKEVRWYAGWELEKKYGQEYLNKAMINIMSRKDLICHGDVVWVVKDQDVINHWTDEYYWTEKYGWYIPHNITNPSIEYIEVPYEG